MRTILLFFFLLTIFTGCHKIVYPPPKPKELDSIPVEFKAWTLFQPGSYWIYLNEGTQVSESTFIKHGPYFYQWSTEYSITDYTWYFVDNPFILKYDIQGGGERNTVLQLWTWQMDDPVALTIKTIEDPANSDFSSSYIFTYELIEKLDSLELNSHVFYNVFHTRCTQKKNNDYSIIYDYYFMRNVGLIKFRRLYTYENKDTTWSLLKWKTVQ
ncbi:MAG TPA: hypothetical protein VMC08_01005 [Bacteroidales bacterium]|nr:hypothetical protein [Bacteroidales bacterium]